MQVLTYFGLFPTPQPLLNKVALELYALHSYIGGSNSGSLSSSVKSGFRGITSHLKNNSNRAKFDTKLKQDLMAGGQFGESGIKPLLIYAVLMLIPCTLAHKELPNI